jgi:hypothetical protein
VEIHVTKPKRRLALEEAIIPGLSLLFVLSYFWQTRQANLTVLLWPLGILAILGTLWVLVLIFNLVRKDRSTSSTSKTYTKPILILIISVLYLVLLPSLGFVFSTFLFLNVLFLCLGSKSYFINVFIASAITIILFFGMVVGMDMSLPRLDLGIILL